MFRRHEIQIAAEATLAGRCIVGSDFESVLLDAAQTVCAYKDLAQVERAFRCLKSVGLDDVRPIHHPHPGRVRAHVLLRRLAYCIEWHMRRKLALLLLDGHDREAAAKQRSSVMTHLSPVA